MDESLSMFEVAAKRELTAIGLTDVDPVTLSMASRTILDKGYLVRPAARLSRW